MKTQAELKAIARFVAEYATRLMGSGVHTSRVVRNTKRLGEALGVRVIVSAFQRVVNFSVFDDESGEVYSEVVDIPPLPISFELNAELSALSWEAYDRRLSLEEIEARYREIIARPRIDPLFTLVVVGLANAAFCRLFGGDWFAIASSLPRRCSASSSSRGCRTGDSTTTSYSSPPPSSRRCTPPWR